MAFTQVISKAKVSDLYLLSQSYALVHGVKLPSLDEALSLTYENDVTDSAFSEDEDAAMEKHALKLLEEKRARKQANG